MIGPLETVTAPTRAEAMIQVGLECAGCTFDELAAQARSGRFESLHARMAWVAIGMYDDKTTTR
ncbi:hypothetical protein [Nocardia brevicatena]|uniref:hypothetical protein n=1 Tax=Nocardia brevicatena TaxID=37327 RepID=UPI0002E68EFC|nr:hypothetical protein [Nocardia brevicatena]